MPTSLPASWCANLRLRPYCDNRWTYARVSPATELLNLKQSWPGELLQVRQGHFGYRALKETLREIEKFL